MNLVLKFRDRLVRISRPLVLELEQLTTIIRTAFRTQHRDDGTHGAVTATSLAATRVAIGGSRAAAALAVARGTGVDGTAVFAGTTNASHFNYGPAESTYIRGGRVTSNIHIGDLNNSGTVYIAENGGVVSIGGIIQFAEMTEPDAPAANGARLYVKDNGSGKTQLCVRFATGAVQVIATEP